MAATDKPDLAGQEMTTVICEFFLLLEESAEYHPDGWLRRWMREAQEEVQVCLRQLERIQKRYVVAFAGLSNVGKSTLINALLGSDLAPHANRPCTATPLEFEYGEEFAVTVSAADSISRRQWRCADAAEVRACLDRIAHNDQAPTEGHIVVRVPASILLSGNVIADTPGFNAAQVENSIGKHDEFIFPYLQGHASRVFGVMMADQGIGKKELEFFRRRLATECHDLVVTGCDDWQERDCDRYRARFMHEFGADPPQFHFVSGKQAIEARTTGDDRLLERSRIGRLESRLRELGMSAGRLQPIERKLLRVATDLADKLKEYRDAQNRPLLARWRPDSWANWIRIPLAHALQKQLHHMLGPR